MTKFDIQVEALAERAREKREEEINLYLERGLRLRTKEEVIKELYACLTFVGRVETIAFSPKYA